MLDRVESAGLTLNEDKAQIRKNKISYFGHEISKEGITPNPEEVRAIQEMTCPSNVTELGSLGGMFNYLTMFTPNLACTLKPLNRLTEEKCRVEMGLVTAICICES